MYRKARKAAASLTVAVLIVAGLAVTAVVRDDPPPRTPSAVTSTVDLAGPGAAAGEAGREPGHRYPEDRDRDRGGDGDAGAGGRGARDRDPFGASCRTTTEGSRVTADCHNPYPDTDRVRLHVECARWWDIDSDSAPAEVRAAGHVRITGRCWKDVATAWVTHERAVP